jgi:hypothetical protein
LLRPDVWADNVILSSGRKITVYRCPFPVEGPVEAVGSGGRPELRFMYAHFVFTWAQGSPTVDVGHGTVRDHHPLWADQPVAGVWCGRVLVRFGRVWTRSHLSRFTARGGIGQ